MKTIPRRRHGVVLALLPGLFLVLLAVGHYRPKRLEASRPAPISVSRPTTSEAVAPAAEEPEQYPSFNYKMHDRRDDVPAWVIPYGGEFWRKANREAAVRRGAAKGELALSLPESVNIGEVVERVSHAFVPDGSGPQVCGETYRAGFDEYGLLFWPAEAGGREPETKASFRTTAITYREQALAGNEARREWSFLGNTAQALLAPETGVIEHYEAGSDGVSVSWIFSKPPQEEAAAAIQPGPADLVVEAAVSGLNYAGETPSGHHFADESGTARLVVGKAVALDSAAKSWPLELAANGNRLRITVPATILSEATYPLAIDPVIGPEFGIDNPVISPATAPAAVPSVAANGTNYMVVWGQPPALGDSRTTIRGARVASSGLILDIAGITINPIVPGSPAAAGTAKAGIRVASAGGDYLVVWEDNDFERPSGIDIFGARLSRAGFLLDTNAIAICRATNTQSSPSVAANATGYLVTWHDLRNGITNIYGARVGLNGIVSETNGFPISLGPQVRTLPAVAANTSDFLVVWQDARSNASTPSIYGTPIKQGVVANTNGVLISHTPGAGAPAVASDGTNFFVTWQTGFGYTGILGARVSSSGGLLDTNDITVTRPVVRSGVPAVAANGTNYLVVWQDRVSGISGSPTNIFGARVSSAGRLVDTNPVTIAPVRANQVSPAIAAIGPNCLVVWQDWRNSTPNVYGARLDANAVVQETNGFLISLALNTETAPAVAFDGTNYLVVWSDARNRPSSGLDIYGARVNASGMVADPNGIAISVANFDQFAPVVAANSSGFFVAWEDDRYATSGTAGDIFGARVTSAGQVLDTNGVAISTLPTIQTATTIAAGTNGFLVVWMSQGPSLFRYDVYGTVVNNAGVVSITNGTSFSDNSADPGQGYPAAAFNGSEFLVVWSDASAIDSTGYNILGVRVSSSGGLLDNHFIPVYVGNYLQTLPAVASNGKDFLAAWVDYRNYDATFLTDIYGSRVTAGGSVLDPNGLPIAVLPGPQDDVAIAPDGTNYFVVWQDSNGTHGARVTAAGTLPDGNAPLTLDTSAARQAPDIAAGSLGQFLVVGQTIQASGSNRIVGSFVFEDVNHPPTFTKGPDQTVLTDTGIHTITNWATNISPGPTNESLQQVNFLVENNNASLFDVQPAISPDGTLTYALAEDHPGVATVTLRLHDNGGTANGGQDTSAPQTFTISVIPANDGPLPVVGVAPNFLLSTNQSEILVITPDSLSATVTFDASGSTDPENDPIQFTWSEFGLTNAFASGPIVTNSFAAGDYIITLTLSAGDDTVVTNIPVEIITPDEAVARLMILLDDSGLVSKSKQPLMASLTSALASFDRGDDTAARNQLSAFQNKATAQVSPADSGLAAELVLVAQQIIDAFP